MFVSFVSRYLKMQGFCDVGCSNGSACTRRDTKVAHVPSGECTRQIFIIGTEENVHPGLFRVGQLTCTEGAVSCWEVGRQPCMSYRGI